MKKIGHYEISKEIITLVEDPLTFVSLGASFLKKLSLSGKLRDAVELSSELRRNGYSAVTANTIATEKVYGVNDVENIRPLISKLSRCVFERFENECY